MKQRAHAYDSLSRRQSVTYGNGTSVFHGYSSRGDLIDHDLSFAGPASVNYDYAYNGVGQLLSRTVSDPGFNWLPLASATESYSVNGLNQYTSVGGASPVYDGNGNLTTDHNGRSFAYDAENVLRTASGLAGGTATYRYHADGARRQKIYDGTTTEFYYMGGLGYLDEEDTAFAADQEIAEYEGSTGGGAPSNGNLVRRYIRLPGSVDETFLMIDYSINSSGDEYWAHQDRLGSVVAVSDATGAVVEKYRYSPYGLSGHEGDSGFPFRFTGQKLDAETGLYYYKARYYDPETGRFLQTDPIGYEDQMNMYAYVANDPVNATDPTGECTGSRITDAAGLCGSSGGFTTQGPAVEVEYVATVGDVTIRSDKEFTAQVSRNAANGADRVESADDDRQGAEGSEFVARVELGPDAGRLEVEFTSDYTAFNVETYTAGLYQGKRPKSGIFPLPLGTANIQGSARRGAASSSLRPGQIQFRTGRRVQNRVYQRDPIKSGRGKYYYRVKIYGTNLTPALSEASIFR